MAKKKDTLFYDSATRNNYTYMQYYNQLCEIAISMFEWKNMPSSVDPRFLELCLLKFGQCVFFEDEALGFLALQNTTGGPLNVYNIPTRRVAIASNGYRKELNYSNSVIIFNNALHSNAKLNLTMFAKRLYNIDRTIDVNVNSQKTPVLIRCDETERLTMLNLYKQYDGNQPFIFGSKGLNANQFEVLTTEAPYISDKLFELKMRIWDEALTFLGITNVTNEKKERMITQEVSSALGGVMASRYSRLNERQMAAKKINEMFGLNVECVYRDGAVTPDVGGDSDE